MKASKNVVDRVKETMADANAFIDQRAAEVAKVTPGVPVDVLRRCLTRGMGCACSAALLIAEEMEKEQAP